MAHSSSLGLGFNMFNVTDIIYNFDTNLLRFGVAVSHSQRSMWEAAEPYCMESH